jgi:hypothetical protein
MAVLRGPKLSGFCDPIDEHRLRGFHLEGLVVVQWLKQSE